MPKHRIAALWLLLIAAAVLLALLVWRLTGNYYRLDYCGQKDLYTKARDSYLGGSTVRLCFPFVATDTDYTLYLNGEPISYTYSDSKGFVIEFPMPLQDSTLEMQSRNSMVIVPPPQETMIFIDFYSFDPSDGSYRELVLEAPDELGELTLTEYRREEGGDEQHRQFSAPEELLDSCCEVIERYDMESWNGLSEYESLEGAELVLRFSVGLEQVRVSSDCMPPDGEKAFREIESILSQHIS